MIMTNKHNYKQMLEFINPAILSYEEWLKIGQALHYEGEPMTTWQEWSWRDPRRAIETDFEAKWDSFNDNRGDVVTGGTICHIAEQYGYKKESREINFKTKYDWDSIIAEPSPFNFKVPTTRDTINFLQALGFHDDDYIAYCRADAFNEVVYTRTLTELLNELSLKGFDYTFGTYDPEAGMFITFNPLDGTGRKVKNVTRFMNTLIECDPDADNFAQLSEEEQKQELFNQLKKIKELNLPCRVITYSGKKSIHAIVRIDASNQFQYTQRVTELQEYCRAHGLNVDTANKDACRFSRMPGAKRGNRWQFLVETNSGAKDWDEWQSFIKAKELLDKLPPIKSLADIAEEGIADPPPELIEGIFRAGGKLVVSAKSKAGKTFLLMQLAIALGTGGKWLGRQCLKSKVLYVDLELNPQQSQTRFAKICEKLRLQMRNIPNVELWNLRGEGLVGNSLADTLIAKVTKQQYDMVIIDPLYKMLDGAENDSKDVGDFTRTIDRICKSLHTAVCYSHHNKKGLVEGDPIDMSSGSSVIARDADTMIVLIKDDKFFQNVDIDSLDLSFDFNKDTPIHKVYTIMRDFKSLPDNTYIAFDYPCHYLLEDVRMLDEQNEERTKKQTVKKNNQKEKVYSYLDSSEMPIKINEVAKAFGLSEKTVKNYVDENIKYDRTNGEIHSSKWKES